MQCGGWLAGLVVYFIDVNNLIMSGFLLLSTLIHRTIHNQNEIINRKIYERSVASSRHILNRVILCKAFKHSKEFYMKHLNIKHSCLDVHHIPLRNVGYLMLDAGVVKIIMRMNFLRNFLIMQLYVCCLRWNSTRTQNIPMIPFDLNRLFKNGPLNIDLETI